MSTTMPPSGPAAPKGSLSHGRDRRSPTRPSTAGPRSRWKAVGLPAEHGGWGLTLEAGILGLAVRPSLPGAALALAGLLAFLTRTPLKLALVDRWRRRRLERTVLAERLAGFELAALVGALAFTASSTKGAFWLPLAGAALFFGLELAYDIRSRGRRLVPELSGAIGMAALPASIALAGGASAHLAMGLWVVLAGRALSSVPFAYTQVRRLHRRPDLRWLAEVLQPVALAVVAAGKWFGWVSWPALGAVGALACWELLELQRPVHSARRVGMAQLAGGLVVVTATALGARL
jgi:hypothetical protein